MAEQLVETTLGTLDLTPENGYVVEGLNLGFPAPRDVVAVRVNTNGTDDVTAFYGARAVSMTVAVFAAPGVTRRSALDRLRAFTSPSRRPTLFFNDDDPAVAPDRMLRLRGDQLGSLLDNPTASTAQVQWVAPDGIIESATQQDVTVGAVLPAEAGRSYPRVYNLTYPSISAIGSVAALNEGTEPATPVLRLWGPCTDPVLYNLTTGEQLTLTGVALTAEQYVEIDIREATIRMQGLATQNLYTNLTTDSVLWWVAPGVNRVRYSPAVFAGAARAQVIFRSAWI